MKKEKKGGEKKRGKKGKKKAITQSLSFAVGKTKKNGETTKSVNNNEGRKKGTTTSSQFIMDLV